MVNELLKDLAKSSRNSLHVLEYDESEIHGFLADAKNHEVKIMKSPVGSEASLTSTGSQASATASQSRLLSTCSISDIEKQVDQLSSVESVATKKRKAEEEAETKRQLAITLSELQKQK